MKKIYYGLVALSTVVLALLLVVRVQAVYVPKDIGAYEIYENNLVKQGDTGDEWCFEGFQEEGSEFPTPADEPLGKNESGAVTYYTEEETGYAVQVYENDELFCCAFWQLDNSDVPYGIATFRK